MPIFITHFHKRLGYEHGDHGRRELFLICSYHSEKLQKEKLPTPTPHTNEETKPHQCYHNPKAAMHLLPTQPLHHSHSQHFSLQP